MTIRGIHCAAIMAVVSMLAFVPSAFAATPPGTLTVEHPPTHLNDKDGAITLRIRYSCLQYEAPYVGSDVLIASIVTPGGLEGEYDAFTEVTCDGQTHKLTLDLPASAGPISGPATLELAHEGFSGPGMTGIGIVRGDLQLNSPVVVH